MFSVAPPASCAATVIVIPPEAEVNVEPTGHAVERGAVGVIVVVIAGVLCVELGAQAGHKKKAEVA